MHCPWPIKSAFDPCCKKLQVMNKQKQVLLRITKNLFQGHCHRHYHPLSNKKNVLNTIKNKGLSVYLSVACVVPMGTTEDLLMIS